METTRNKYYNDLINSNKLNKQKLWDIFDTLSGRICKSVDEADIKAFEKYNLTVKAIANNFGKEFCQNVKNMAWPHLP